MSNGWGKDHPPENPTKTTWYDIYQGSCVRTYKEVPYVTLHINTEVFISEGKEVNLNLSVTSEREVITSLLHVKVVVLGEVNS